MPSIKEAEAILSTRTPIFCIVSPRCEGADSGINTVFPARPIVFDAYEKANP